MAQKSSFSSRRFTSLVLLLSALVMGVSGLVLYVVPEGRISYWMGWKLLGLGKGEWGDLHLIVSLLFLAASLAHLYYNWRAVKSYLKAKATGILAAPRELLAAVFVAVLFAFGAVAGLPPFAQIVDLGKESKKMWYAGQDVHPPFPHAEIMSLKQLARKVDFSLEGALAHLRAEDFDSVGKESTLKELSAKRGITPAAIFEKMMMDDRLYE